jgi:hypothetical protein
MNFPDFSAALPFHLVGNGSGRGQEPIAYGFAQIRKVPFATGKVFDQAFFFQGSADLGIQGRKAARVGYGQEGSPLLFGEK